METDRINREQLERPVTAGGEKTEAHENGLPDRRLVLSKDHSKEIRGKRKEFDPGGLDEAVTEFDSEGTCPLPELEEDADDEQE